MFSPRPFHPRSFFSVSLATKRQGRTCNASSTFLFRSFQYSLPPPTSRPISSLFCLHSISSLFMFVPSRYSHSLFCRSEANHSRFFSSNYFDRIRISCTIFSTRLQSLVGRRFPSNFPRRWTYKKKEQSENRP